MYGRWPVLCLDTDAPIGGKAPGETRYRRVVQDDLVEGQDAAFRIGPTERVIRIRNVPQVLRAAQIPEIELRGVRWKILVAGSVDNELRHGQAITVEIRILNPKQGLVNRRAHSLLNFVSGVILDGRCPETIRAEMVNRTGTYVDDIDDDWNDSHHPPVGGTCQPGRPATFRGAGHDEMPDGGPATCGTGQQGGHRVHGPDRALDH